jgi:hypothetical protein
MYFFIFLSLSIQTNLRFFFKTFFLSFHFPLYQITKTILPLYPFLFLSFSKIYLNLGILLNQIPFEKRVASCRSFCIYFRRFMNIWMKCVEVCFMRMHSLLWLNFVAIGDNVGGEFSM